MDFPFLEPRGWGIRSAAQPQTNCAEFPQGKTEERTENGGRDTIFQLMLIGLTQLPVKKDCNRHRRGGY